MNYTPFFDGESPAHTAINQRFAELEAAVNTVLTGFSSGTILPYGGAAAPSTYLLCAGSAVSRSTYAALFAVIGTTYGVGDGSTTFNLPDLRGRTPIGAGTGVGLTARTLAQQLGEENHQLTIPELPSHTHSGTIAQVLANFLAGASSGLSTNIASGSTGSDTPHNTMQPSLVVSYIIKT